MAKPNLEERIIQSVKKSLKKYLPPQKYGRLSGTILELPKDSCFGDFSCTVAMRLSREAGRSPIELANEIKRNLAEYLKNWGLGEEIEKIEVAPPGYINFYLSKKHLHNILNKIYLQKGNFGASGIGRRKKVLIEFVSANPTGPLNVAHGRQAVVGDSLARILRFCGFKVTKEYYLNDEGTQIDLLGESIWARCRELQGEKVDFPQNGYAGSYIYEIAKAILSSYKKDILKKKKSEFFSRFGINYILGLIKKDLCGLGVRFDCWISQKDLRKTGRISRAISLLSKRGYLYEKDSALWLKSSLFGDDKDRVVIKSDGSLTYIAGDIAYHREKFKRGFNWIINLWGPDHHGYVGRLMAAIKAMGFGARKVSIRIVQLTSLYKGKVRIAMSTRKGEYVTLSEVINAAGKDAVRFFFLMRKISSHLDFDIELAKKKSLENPVYYVQYAHARICSILDYARQKNIHLPRPNKVLLELISSPAEMEIIKVLRKFSQVVNASLENLEPQGLTVYLQELATYFHKYYDTHRVVSEDDRLTRARLLLINSVRTVLANGLNLIGVGAPKKM
jgi:arginyl-tRNA synthetase